jgi:hypothetical protein
MSLLRALVAGDGDAVAGALADPATDLMAFFGFARRHQLASFAYWTLRRLDLAAGLPASLRAGLKATALLERERSEQLLAPMEELASLFERDGLRVMFLKGPLFAKRYYGSLEARSVADLDVLVATPGDLARAERLLREARFEPAFRIPVSRGLARFFAHHFEYRRDGIPVDLHWALQRHFTFALDDERLWAGARSVRLGPRDYLAASDEYELVLQILGALTDLQVGKLRLRTLVDLAHVLPAVQQGLAWPEFFAARRRERILRPSAYVLALVLDVLDAGPRFPALTQALAPMRATLPPTARAEEALRASRPTALGQKLLALRLYEAPLAAALGWWLLSLPFRMAVYGPSQGSPRA